jgi:hypothetical protein
MPDKQLIKFIKILLLSKIDATAGIGGAGNGKARIALMRD